MGNGILDRFDILLDFKNNNLYLKPNQTIDNIFEIPCLGFKYVDRSQTMQAWIVTGIFENSNAQKAGLKIDDKFLTINGVSIKEIQHDKFKAILKKIDVIKLTIIREKSKKEINFKLKNIL